MLTEGEPTRDPSAPDRWNLVRDIAVLQVKLIVDGLRDFILVPISIGAGLISLARAGDPSGNEFYKLLRIGKRSERWINLFGAADKVPEPAEGRVRFPDADIDELVGKAESFVVDEYREGRVTKQAKEQLDQLLGSMNRRKKRRGQETAE
jgi:hypothetical protein